MTAFCNNTARAATGVRVPQAGDAVTEIAVRRREVLERIDTADMAVRRVLADPAAKAVLGHLSVPPSVDVRRPLDEAARLVQEYLAPIVDAGFRSDSAHLRTTARRLSRLSGQLREAAEAYARSAVPVDAAADRLAVRIPGHPRRVYQQAALAARVLAGWSAADRGWEGGECSHPVAEVLEDSVLRALSGTGALHCVVFVCPPVDFRLLRSPAPEAYLLDHFHGSVLSRLVRRLRGLFRTLETADLPVRLHAMLADTDEDDYLWSVEERAELGLDRRVLEARWDRLASGLATYLSEPIQRGGEHEPRVADRENVFVTRLSSWARSDNAERLRAAILADVGNFFGPAELAEEHAIMRGLWRPGDYYEGLPKPTGAAMEKILARKFASYAAQGLQLRELDPDSVLVQTERPALLRERMFAAGWRHGGHPPVATVQYFPPTPRAK